MAGIRRAFQRAGSYRGKIFGPILAGLSALILGFFVLLILFTPVTCRLRPAPRVGAKAPDFTLTDSDNKTVPLANLLTEQVGGAAPKGVLLVFYRGYW